MGAVLVEGVKGCGKTRTARRVAASEALFDADPNLARSVELDPAIVLGGDSPAAGRMAADTAALGRGTPRG